MPLRWKGCGYYKSGGMPCDLSSSDRSQFCEECLTYLTHLGRPEGWGPLATKKGDKPDEEKSRLHMLEALRHLARYPCDKRNCGSVCLCGPCHAREAITFYDPDWKP